jgi:hypothetical protein
MATTVAFDLCSKLFDVFTANVPAGVRVYDGPGFSEDPGNFLMIGVDDPESEDPTSAAGTQEWSGIGAKAALEDGVISCCAMAWTGDSGDAAQKAVRQTVRDIVGAVDVVLRADPNLGGAVPGLNWVRYGHNYRLSQPPAAGVAAKFYFEIAYKARLV